MCVLVCSSDQFTGPVTQKVSIIQLELASLPGPAQLSVACSTASDRKVGGAPGAG